jgi:hypothetical protein
VLVKNYERVGIDDTGALDWRELAVKRLARLVESEQAHTELQGQVERLRKEHSQLLTALHGRVQRVATLERELEDRDAELARLGPVMNSWWGHGWCFMQWAHTPANWLALAKRPIKRLLKSMAGIRALRRLVGMALRLTPGLRARLLAMIELV